MRKLGKVVMISDDYPNIGQLLLPTIIASNKNCTILINVKENITVNWPNWLIVYPYTVEIIETFNVHKQVKFLQ